MRGNIILAVIYILITLNLVFAAPFRYGNIVWRIPDPDNAPTTVELKVGLSFDLSISSIIPTVGSLLSPGNLDFGDGTVQPVSLLVSLVDSVVGLLQGSYTVRYTYAIGNTPKNITVSTYSGSRSAFLNNNANAFYNVSTLITLNQYVTNRRGRSVLNNGPIASMLPLVTLYANEITGFRIPAYDRETANLIYTLSSAIDMGYATLTQPNQLSVNSTGHVIFNTNGMALGYYSTQIKVSDGLAYVVVDFMILVIVRPIALPCLVPPFPLDGAILTLYANVQFSLQIQAVLSLGNLLPGITSTLLPSNLTINAAILGSATLQWTPTLSDIGAYVIALGCRTTLGLVCPAQCQNTFTLNVVNPPCGFGSATPAGCDPTTNPSCSCVCPIGYDITTNCTTCAAGYYGANCTACQCLYGTCNQGMSGTGACTCFSGWRGAKCDTAIKPCNFSVPGYVRQIVNTTNSLVTPTSTTVLVTAVPTVVNLVASIPLVAPKIDVMLLVDTSGTISISTLLNLQGLLATTFASNLGGLSPSVHFALSTFSNPTSCLLSLSVSLKLSLTASTSDFLAALSLYLAPTVALGCTVRSQGSQLGALLSVTATSAGWRSDSFKVVVVITDSVFGEGGQYYSDRATVKNALLAINAVPLFITPISVQPVYSALVSDWGFGTYNTMLSTWANSYNVAFNTIKTALTYVWAVTQDAQNFTVNTAQSLIVTPPALAYFNMTLRNLNSSVTTLSTITVNVVGWGIATITPQVNQAPVTAVVAVTTREDIGTTVPLNGTDADGDSLNVIVDILPTKGTLYTNSSALAAVRVNTSYSLPDGVAIPLFYYVPNLRYYGSDSLRFYLHDGCTRSANSANATLTITFYNYPPVASTATTFTNENTNATLQFTVSDVEDTLATLTTLIRSLPDPNLATIYHINNGSAVQVNDMLAASVNHTVRYVPKLYACCDTSSITFQVRDSGNQSSNVATLSTFIVHVNQPPTATAAATVYVDRGVSTAITISVFDPDANDVETFTISGIGAGSYYASNGSSIASVPYSLAPISMTTSTTNSQTVNFTGLANSIASSLLRFYVTDAAGLSSSAFTVTINVNPNQAPVTRTVATVSSTFLGTSSIFYLYGTDPDPADTPNTLQIVITSLPTKGTLNVNGNNVTTFPITVANNASCYVIGNQISGNDQFSFRVQDQIGGLSVAQSVNIRFNAINRPPTATINSIVTQEDVEVVGRINANDPDGDTLTVYITVLPVNGTLKQFDGTNITSVPTALTDSNYQFRFLPGLHEYGSPYANFSFYVNDGAASTSTMVSTFNVTFVNYPPVAISTTVSIPEESPATPFTISTSDVETPATTVAVIVTLPPASAGVLTDMNNNTLSVGSTIASPWQLQFTPTTYFVGVSSFQFKANDGTQNSSNIGTLTINVTHVNLPPTSQVYLGTAVRGVNFPITLANTDPNMGDVLTVTVTSYGGLGNFSSPDSKKRGPFPQSTPFNLPYTLTVPQSRTVSTVLSYIAPGGASGINYANISYYVTDQTGLSSAITTAYVNIATNNPPTVNPIGTISVTQDSLSNPFSLNGTDPDVADVLNLSIVLLSLPSKGTLFFANGTAITSAPLILSVTSAVSLQYLTNQRGSDQFSFTVQDLLLARAVAITANININNVNHPPVAQWLGNTVGNEDTVITISQMGAYDQDPDDTVFSYYISSPPTAGNITQADGSSCASYPCLVTSSSHIMLFTPAQDANGSPYATFTFYVVDSHNAISLANATGTINVIPVNDPPVANPSTARGDENTNITVSLNITDVDTPAANLSIIIISLPPASMGYLMTQAGVIIKAGDVVSLQNLVFVPVTYTNGNAGFSFQASDGQAFSSVASCVITVNSVTQPPTAGISRPSPIVVARSSVTTFNLLAIDPDQGETYTFQLTSFQHSSGAAGTLALANGNAITASTTVIGNATSAGLNTPLAVTYTVTAIDESLNFTFTVFDGTYTSTAITVVMVMSDNIPPVVATPPGTVYALEELMSAPIGMNGTDPDDSRPVTVVILSLPSNGVLYVNSSYAITQTGALDAGVFSATYLGNALFYGSDSYEFAIMDADGSLSPTQIVNISVAHVNHAPTAYVGTINGVEDVPLNITQIIANDVDGDTLYVVLPGAPSPSGSFAFVNGTPITNFPAMIPYPFQFTFVPAQYANGVFSFSFYVTDGQANSSLVSASITVAGVNYPPVAQDSYLVVNENALATNFNCNITDVDSPDSAIVARILSLPPSSLGIVTTPDGQPVSVGQLINSPRVLTFTPAAYVSGVGSISFTARDELSYSTNSATITINVTHVDYAPVASAATPAVVTRGTELVVPVQAVDMNAGDSLTFTLVGINGGGVLSSTSQGSAIANNTVFASGNVASSGAAVTANLYYNVPNTATGNTFGSFTFIATDQTGQSSAPFTVTFSIAPNHLPTANATSVNIIQDQTSAPFTLSGADEDVADQGSLLVYITVLPTKGYLVQGSTNITSAPSLVTGPLTYTTSERGADSFSFQVVDNVGGTSQTMRVPISITPVNHPPVVSFSGSALTVNENTNLVINQISAYDIDGDVVTIYVGSLPSVGSLTQYDGTPITAPNTPVTDPQNRIIYVPASALTNQSTSFTFYAGDNSGSSNSNTSAITVPITVIHINVPPVVYNSVLALNYGANSGVVTPNVTDVDSSSLQITILSIPAASIGTLSFNNIPVAVGDIFAYPVTFGFQVVPNSYGYTDFTFTATDGISVSTSAAVYGIGVRSPINHAPQASASASLTAQRGVALSIALSAHDDDVLETFTYSITTQSSGGIFASGNTVLSPPSFNITKAEDPNTYYTNAILSFTAPVNAVGSDFLIVNFTVYDTAQSVSNGVGISVSIAPNNLPVASAPPTITYNEDANSTTFILGGTDADPADANSLYVTFTVLPSKGTIYLVGYGPITTTGGKYLQNSTFFIVGTPLKSGSDSFTYELIDNVDGTSNPQQVPITITHVNHAPQAMISLAQGAMNQPLSFQIYGQDVDPNTFFTAYITEVPAQGTLSQSDGTPITTASPSSPVAVTSTLGNLIYIPPSYVYGPNVANISFYVSDNSGASNSNSEVQSATISIAKGDFPPVAYSSTASAADGGQVIIVLNAVDPQGYPIVATITQFPSSGTLYRSDGTAITPQNPTVGNDLNVVFVPVNGTYGQNVTFSYQVSSTTSGLSSNTASVSTSVYRVYSTPSYTGQTTFSIPENAVANLYFTATSQASFYSIIVVGTPSVGSLAFVNGDTQTDITGIAPYLMNNSNSENRAKYVPPTNTSGVNLAVITIQVQDEHGLSAPINISITVYHVDIAPYIVPTVYRIANTTTTGNFSTYISVPENHCAIVSWDIYDVDSPRSNLSSMIASLPFRGNIHMYNADGSMGDIISTQITINESPDGYYHVYYCPEENKSGTNYASFSVIASDAIVLSDRRYINFNIIHTTITPAVIVTQPQWNASLNTQTLITGVSLADADARIFNIKFVLSASFDDGAGTVTALDAANTISLYQYNETYCDATSTSITCIATIDKLNVMLNQITIDGQATAGNVTLNIYVDDMGLGLGISSARNGSGSVQVQVFPNTNAKGAGNNNVLTATVASAAVVGAAAAAGIYGYLRKRSPPTSTFFGLEQGLMSGGINENPLYEGGVTMENSLYRAPTFGMQKLN